MTDSLTKRLKGYQKVFRERHLAARDMRLTDTEYRLWDLMVALADWDVSHEAFNTVMTTDRALAEILRWSRSKACRTRESLIKKGIINQLAEGHYQIVARMDKQSANVHTESAPLDRKGASTQQSQGKNEPSSLVSSKGNISLIRSDEEYQKIWNEGDYTMLTIEDMKWIDQNY